MNFESMSDEERNYWSYKTQAAEFEYYRAVEMRRPFMILRPRIFPDGNQWCALLGDDIQTGVCGFGDTPEKASRDFDTNWLSQHIMQK